jgi:hypothetical protein
LKTKTLYGKTTWYTGTIERELKNSLVARSGPCAGWKKSSIAITPPSGTWSYRCSSAQATESWRSASTWTKQKLRSASRPGSTSSKRPWTGTTTSLTPNMALHIQNDDRSPSRPRSDAYHCSSK